MREVRTIPNGWQKLHLEDMVDFLDGQRRPIKSADREHMKGQYPYYGASGIIDWVNDFLYDDDLILLGEDGENILSRNLPLAFKVSGKIWVNNHAHVLRPKSGFGIDFLTEVLEFQEYSDLNTGTAQPKLNKHSCKTLEVCVPINPDEQRAIAEALTDADGLIAGLERLIAKKRQIKQGAMQDLLTARRRLPGFSGEWEDVRLGNLAKVSRGASPRPIKDPRWFKANSGIGWVRISDLSKNEQFLQSTTQELSEEGKIRSRPVAIGSLIMSIAATLGRPAVTTFETCIHDGFVVFTSLQIQQEFLYFILRKLEPTWSEQGQTGSQMNLNTPIIENTVLTIPTDSAEQTAIANVLSEMDAEIQGLQARLNKARAVKEGMMQVLLTGRVRLV